MQQHPYYADALRTLGAKITILSVRKNGHRVAQVQCVERWLGPVRLLWLPRGPVWAPRASDCDKYIVIQELCTQLDHPIGLLACPDDMSDLSHYRHAGFHPLITAQYHAELPLTPPMSERRARQSQKWRNRLRHAERSALKVHHDLFDPRKDAWLLHHDQAQQRAKSYTALPAAFTTAWGRQHPTAIRIFKAQIDTHTVAAILILRHPPTASYHIGWSGSKGRKHSAHNLLIWVAANWLAAQGCQRLDLGTVDTQNAPGLARFKLGSGAILRPTGPTLLRLPHRSRRRIAA